MASVYKTATGENVDFDFFSTPRNDDSRLNDSPEPDERVYYKPPPSVKQPKHGEDLRASDSFSAQNKERSDSESSDSDLSSDIETESDHSDTPRKSDKNKDGDKLNGKRNAYSDESSSAYSDSSSDDESKIIERERLKKQKAVPDRKYNRPSDKDRPLSSKEAWGSGIEKVEIVNKKCSDSEQNVRPKSSKYDSRRRGLERKGSNGRSASDSEMTDVSPLPSPRESEERDVQYENVENGDGEVQLESKKLDLSILMEAVSEIENNNREQRIKSNTRRVMFQPPGVTKSKSEKSNYSFDQGRVKMIEKENQRLLSEIMKHIGPNKRTKKKIVHHGDSPVVQRATPSAINRQREQRRIEGENMVGT